MHNPLKQLLCTSFIAQPFRRSWYSTEGDSEIVGVERMSVTYRQPACTVKLKMIICGNRKKEMNYKDKRHSENTDTSCDLSPCGVTTFRQAQESWCHLLYCTLLPGMISMDLLLYKISTFVYFMWPLTFTCDLQLLSMSLAFMLLNVCTKNEVCRFSRIWNMDIRI